MRVIAGMLRSRRFGGKPPAGIRPTSDKLRETLFNVLGPAIEGAVFLDGCAGMGGIGIEAVSRGARAVHFVDRSAKACALIRGSLASLDIRDGVRVVVADLERALDDCARDAVSFDFAYIDPPYERGELYGAALDRFGRLPLLAEEGILVIEHSKRVEMPGRHGPLVRFRALVQGDSALAFYRKASEDGPGPTP
jgi:16S rRNA (guanine(966)-N(2))-methyltransferase RsmD